MTKIRTNSHKQVTHPFKRDRRERALALRQKQLGTWKSGSSGEIARLRSTCRNPDSSEEKIAKAESDIARLQEILGSS